MHTVNIRFRAALLILASCCVLSAKATNYYWKSDTGDIEYETTTNWESSPDGLSGMPGEGDAIWVRGGTQTVRLNANHRLVAAVVGTTHQTAIYGKAADHQMTIDLNGYDFTIDGSSVMAIQYYSRGTCSREHWKYDLPTTTYTIKGPGNFLTPGGAKLIFQTFGKSLGEGGLRITHGAVVHLRLYTAWRNASRIRIDDNGVWDPCESFNMNQSTDAWDWDRGTGFLLVEDGGLLAATNYTVSTCCDNWLHVMDGGTAVIKDLRISDATTGSRVFNGRAVVSNGFLDVRNSINVGGTKADSSTPNLYVCGQYSLVTLPDNKTLTFYETTGAKLEIRVPVDGFSDRLGTPRAPIRVGNVAFNSTRSASFENHGSTTLEIWCMDWANEHPGETIDLIRMPTGKSAALENLASRLAFGDVPQALVNLGKAPTLSVVDDGTETLLQLTASSSVAEATPPEFTIRTAPGAENGQRQLLLDVVTYGYLATKASSIAVEWWNVQTPETVTNQVLATNVDTACPATLSYMLEGCREREGYSGRVTIVNDQTTNDVPLSATVAFNFTDEGHAETFRWVADGGGRWEDLANWENLVNPAKPVLEPPHSEDTVYFPTNPGVCTVTMNGDYGVLRMANIFRGTTADPLHFVMDMCGHTFTFSEPTAQWFAYVQTSGFIPQYDKGQPPSVLEFRNGTVTASRMSGLQIDIAGGVILSNVAMTANLKAFTTGSRLTMLGKSILTISDTLWVSSSTSAYNSYLRVTEQSSVSNDHNTYMNGVNPHIYVEDGGAFTCQTMHLGYTDSTNAAVVVDGGTFIVNTSMEVCGGTDASHAAHHSRLSISGERGYAWVDKSLIVRMDSASRVDINMPVNGFRDGEGNFREGLRFNKFERKNYGDGIASYGPFAVNVRCRDWVRRHPGETAPIVRMRQTGVADFDEMLTAFTNSVRIVDRARATLSVATEGTDAVVTLTAGPQQGQIMVLR